MTRSTHVQVRLSEEEKADLRAQANELNLSLSEFIRQQIFFKELKAYAPSVDGKVVTGEAPDDAKWVRVPPGPPNDELQRKILAKLAKGRTPKLAEIEAREELGL